eukprot:jgi/Botrbrau1/21146/Bobra.0061s0040.1
MHMLVQYITSRTPHESSNLPGSNDPLQGFYIPYLAWPWIIHLYLRIQQSRDMSGCTHQKILATACRQLASEAFAYPKRRKNGKKKPPQQCFKLEIRPRIRRGWLPNWYSRFASLLYSSPSGLKALALKLYTCTHTLPLYLNVCTTSSIPTRPIGRGTATGTLPTSLLSTFSANITRLGRMVWHLTRFSRWA